MKNFLSHRVLNGRCAATILALGTAGLSGTSALAQAMNDPPPAGAILDLNGQAINHGAAATESVSFVAGVTDTNVTFAFREDPAFISFSDVSLVDTTNPGGNLILNGDFSSGSGQNPTDWTYVNEYGATFGGVVSGSCGGGFATCWYDGSVQAYDAITQLVTTTVGDSYTLSFGYSDNGPYSTFSALSTNGDVTDTGGNGVDITAYAQAGIPPPATTPEPGSLILTASGLIGAAGVLRRRFAA